MKNIILASIFFALPILFFSLTKMYLIEYSEWFYLIPSVMSGISWGLFAKFAGNIIKELYRF